MRLTKKRFFRFMTTTILASIVIFGSSARQQSPVQSEIQISDSLKFDIKYLKQLDSAPDNRIEIDLANNEILSIRKLPQSYIEIRGKKDSAIAYRKEYFAPSGNIKSQGQTFHDNAIGKWRIYKDSHKHQIIKKYNYDSLFKFNVYQLRDLIQNRYGVNLMDLNTGANVTILHEDPKYIVQLRESPKIRVIIIDPASGKIISEGLILERE